VIQHFLGYFQKLNVSIDNDHLMAFFYRILKIKVKCFYLSLQCFFLFERLKRTLYLHSGAHSQNCEERLLALSCLSVCPAARNNSLPTKRMFMKFDI